MKFYIRSRNSTHSRTHLGISTWPQLA